MNIKYRIVNVIKSELTASVVVQYYVDEFAEGYFFNVDIDVDEQGNTMSKEALHEKIMFHAPVGQLEQAVKMSRIAPKLDLSEIQSLVEELPADHPYMQTSQPAENQPSSTGAIEI